MTAEYPDPVRGATAVISRFVKRWDEALRDPQNRRLEPSAANVIVALHKEVVKWIDRKNDVTASHKKYDLHKRLDDLFLKTYNSKDPDIALLKGFHPIELETIEREAKRQNVDPGILAAALSSVVETINAPSKRVAGLIASELPGLSAKFAAGEYTTRLLDEAADLAVRAALVHEEPDALKQQVRHWLSEGSVAVVLANSMNSMLEDVALQKALRFAAKDILAKVRNTIASRDLADRPEPEIGYAQLWQAFRAIDDCKSGVEGVAERLGSSLVQTAASRTSFGLFTYFIGENSDELREVWNTEDRAAALIAEGLVKSGWLRWSGSRDFHPWGGFIHESIQHWLASTIARGATPRVISKNKDAVTQLGRWLKSATQDVQSQEQANSFRYLADRNHQGQIHTFWSTIRPQVLEAVCAELDAFINDNDGYAVVHLDGQEFIRSMRAVSASSEKAWEWVNWDRISPSDLPNALGKFSRAYTERREFDVVIPLEGATIPPHSWNTGNISWYSSASHSLGEPKLRNIQSEDGSSIHIWARAMAVSGTAAFEQVVQRLEPILSATSFALSSSQNFGYRPEVDVWYMYGEVGTGYGAWRGRRDRTESSDERVNPMDLERFGKIYEQAFSRASVAKTHSELEMKFKRALFWYRSGRWQKDPTRRLLDHYLALEHFFAMGQGSKDENLANGIGQIEGSWRYRGFPFSAHVRDILDVANELLKRAQSSADVAKACELVVQKQLSSCRNANRWFKSETSWLSPTFVSAVIDAQDPDTVDSVWTLHLAKLVHLAEREEDWLSVDARRKERAWFRMRLLAQRRHEIVHDALTHIPGIKLEADALTETVDRILRYLASHILTHSEGSTVQDILDDLRAPWSECPKAP